MYARKTGTNVNIHFHVICTIYLVVHGWWDSYTHSHAPDEHAPTVHILHMAIAFTHSHLTVLMLFSAYMYVSRRKAANDRIILAASCLFVEVSCGIILRPWQMQWEMSSKPYHSLCKQEIYAQEECEEMWNPVKSLNWLPVFDAVVFILSLVNTLCTAQCSSIQTYIQSTPFGTIYICFNFKLLRKHSDNETRERNKKHREKEWEGVELMIT